MARITDSSYPLVTALDADDIVLAVEDGAVARANQAAVQTWIGAETPAGAQAKVNVHTGDLTSAHLAGSIEFVPGGTIAATTVQDAIVEVAGDATTALSNHTGDSTDAHAASAITFTPTGSIAAVNAQTAIAEANTDAVATAAAALTAHDIDTTTVHGIADTAALYRQGGTNDVAVADGGTGRGSNTAFALIAGGATSTDPHVSISNGTSGHFLKSGGAPSNPAFAAITQGDVASLTTDLGNKQPLDTQLTALATTTSAADQLPYFTGASTATTTTLTSLARDLLDDTTTTLMRSTLGVTAMGTATTLATVNTAITDADVPAALNGLVAVWKGTQAQYDAIVTKDPNTLYAIVA